MESETTNEKQSTTVAPSGLAKASPKSVARVRVEKIRSELNIEKWPAIWQLAKTRNKPSLRVMERESQIDGNRVVSRVEVGYTHLGTLSTEEQKMLYVLIKLWEDSGKPDAQIFFSSRGLARLLKKKGWGTNVIDAITKSLRKLRTVPIEWVNSYYDRTREGDVVIDRRPLTLLGELRIVERHSDGAVNSSQGYFKFDDHFLANLQRNYTKPVCIEEFFKLHSEIAQLIYSHIDLMLFERNKYERRTSELFDDLGLKNAEYSHMYERKRAIERALKELTGIRLSSGVLRSATLEKTVDGKDYKVSFAKGAATEALPVGEPAAVVINNYSTTKDAQTVQAEELIAEFYKLFHGVETHYPQSKETAQALGLIAQHGLKKARHIVAFAHESSSSTKYIPQTFGGILHLASRAGADFDRQLSQAATPTVQAKPESRPAPKEEWRIRGETRLQSLTPEQYQARFEGAKAELFAQNPFMARQPEGSKIQEGVIRASVIRHLGEEPMNLLPLHFLPEWAKPPAQNLPL